ncbi:MarR family transcriptional regulator [Dokdonia sinensis]|uniref:MarR family transcriptional regulator n=1 Tax=Dokdonia sinensis TaxID=2479847 RepID=A0A3M0FTA9_9FLAO|nr:MarR family winged helix-turn-helix transcriptional regulator [Dokdonia sinensis]RMB56040.1 MarR family transcriptional regulator [Dokdonia sinensis]
MESESNFSYQDCISNKVMQLNRIIANIFRKYLKPFGITDSQLSILFVLAKKSDLNQKKLSELVVLEKSSLNRNLSRLENANLISKNDFPYINITDNGRDLVLRITPEWKKAMVESEKLLQNDGKIALEVIMNNIKQ